MTKVVLKHTHPVFYSGSLYFRQSLQNPDKLSHFLLQNLSSVHVLLKKQKIICKTGKIQAVTGPSVSQRQAVV